MEHSMEESRAQVHTGETPAWVEMIEDYIEEA